MRIIVNYLETLLNCFPSKYHFFLIRLFLFPSKTKARFALTISSPSYCHSGIVTKTGAINAGLNSILEHTRKNPKFKVFIIPIIMFLFSFAGATFGMCEEVMVFILITIPLAIALGYDSLTGLPCLLSGQHQVLQVHSAILLPLELPRGFLKYLFSAVGNTGYLSGLFLQPYPSLS